MKFFNKHRSTDTCEKNGYVKMSIIIILNSYKNAFKAIAKIESITYYYKMFSNNYPKTILTFLYQNENLNSEKVHVE